jgi:hypothetical protein
VTGLPELFVGMNKNFVSAAIEGTLIMDGGRYFASQISSPFVMNLRKHHKSMGLVSNMLIRDENIVSVTDSACL